jgi:hypothetical protein
MKPTNLIIALIFSTVFQVKSQDLRGTYENDCYEKLILKGDSTFYYTYPVGHGWDWATGIWEIQSERLILATNPVLDTVDTTFELTLEGNDSVYYLDRYKELEEPYTIVSSDTTVDNFDILTADVMSIACCGGQLTEFSQMFEIKENQIFKLINQDYPDCKKLKKITGHNNK